MSRRTFTDDQEQKIKAEYESGIPMTQLASTYSTSHVSIRNALKRQGAELRVTNGRPLLEVDAAVGEWIKKLRSKGRSQQYIATKLNVSQSIVSRFLRKLGLETNQPRRGDRHGMWSGGRIIGAKGYILVLVQPEDEFASMRNSLGYVPEHRLVVAKHLGRPLVKTETVHHVDGNCANNAIENLQLRQGNHGTGAAHQCLDCGSTNITAVQLQ